MLWTFTQYLVNFYTIHVLYTPKCGNALEHFPPATVQDKESLIDGIEFSN